MKAFTCNRMRMAVVAASLILGGCASTAPDSFTSPGLDSDVRASITDAQIVSEPQHLAAQGIMAMDDGDLKAALEAFNKALKLDMTNSTLNYLVGLSYHLMAIEGDASKFALADEGYKLAIQFDRSNWHAYFQSGLLALDQRDFVSAQSRFAEALMLKDNDADLLYSMLTSSYYAGDVNTAAAMRDRLQKIEPNSPRYLRASALISAALNRGDQATGELAKLAMVDSDSNQAEKLERRLNDWKHFHTLSTDGRQANQDSGDDDVDELEIDENGMVIVDVVIIRTHTDSRSSKGVNLLSGLTMQYGKTVEDLTDTAFDTGTQITDDFSRAITREISIPAIDYSLNIANVTDEYNEILARPSLTATNGEQSEFFSGLYIQAATSPTGDGDPITFDDDVGVRLALTPELLEDGRVKLEIEAERKFLNMPNTYYTGFTSKLESTRTTVNATVAMNFGETLILSGISEKETQKRRTGVPILQDIPIVQYLFSEEQLVDYTKSVLILLTPRTAHYTSRMASLNNEAEALNELKLRNQDWFKAYSNTGDILNQLTGNKLYREFRNGDLKAERWQNYAGFEQRLSNALGMLYY